ncbi:Holo-[acyl-carrier-protein] synthase [Wickerhamomyces ciferrii]|uniref:Holo-[acyl-carrier-protein] synthase n=1 Tax=Wickerhamomyces ciferrii (strain ATCC 14091 / BCRC 22168 / CBS 111 / JCM 3599 / NBRC 0793 / NRRL Y-1031 F-60-10) TaxID=1206466 RepID=K0KIQ1_WICCF|nr:Holo-[acyl-carrier-protein] synthase [Wickerhamomyces ciferrii]CCH41043.1 Holo-[acyl-carrier-protein] synthase [Wickerhamomyces ciferrii]
MSRVLGLGTDIVKLARFHKIVTRNGLASRQTEAFAKKILNVDKEMPLFNKHVKDDDIDKTVRVLAGRYVYNLRLIGISATNISSWAMKEAVFKCLDDKDQYGQKFKDWFKYNELNGRPKIGGLYLEKFPNEEFLLSISHDEDILIASVIRQITLDK